MEVNNEAPVVEETESPSSTMNDSSESIAAPQPPSPSSTSPPEDVELDEDPFSGEDKGLFEIMKLLNVTVQPRQSKSNREEVIFGGGSDTDVIGDKDCSWCTEEKQVDDLFKKLEADVVSEKEREIEQLTSELEKERAAGEDSEKKITKLVEFISFIHEQFGKLVKSIGLLTTKNLDVCNVLNLGPFQDEAETDEFLEGLNSLAKQLLDEFENLGDTKNLLERMNEILKANVDANTNHVPEDIEETCSQEYENLNDPNADDSEVRDRSRSSLSTVVEEPESEISDMISSGGGRQLNRNQPPTPKVRISKKKIIKTENNLEYANKQHGVDHSRRHWGHFCLCGCKYSSKATLGVHIKYMTSEWQFECDICKRRFLFACYLKFHLGKAHGIVDLAQGAFTCSHCQKTFDSRTQIIAHHRSVHRNTSLEGPSRRNNKGKIRRGRNSTRGRLGANGSGTTQQSAGAGPLHGVDIESPAFQCICGNIYSHKSALSVHISTKLYGKVFKCRDCGKRYEIHAELKKHVMHVHKKNYAEGRFGCSICGQPFDSLMDLKIHRQCTHGMARGAGRRKKIARQVATDLPRKDNSSFVADDPPPPVLLSEANCGDVDGEENRSELDVICIESRPNRNEIVLVPLPLEHQELPASPIGFQVDEDSSIEVVCVE